MHKADKLLSKIPKNDRDSILRVLSSLYLNKTDHLDIKKLKGFKNTCRVRVGRYRVIYTKDNEQGLDVLAITKRDEITNVSEFLNYFFFAKSHKKSKFRL